MKKILGLILFSAICFSGHAQLFDKLKNKLNQKINNTIDSATTKKSKPAGSTHTPADTTHKSAPTAPNESTATPAASSNEGAPQEDIKAYSKFDFIPGAKIIVEENFSQDSIGDFPDKWNTKTSAEVVTLNNKPGRWLCFKQDGVFFPEYIPNLPDNFTLQLDIMANNNVSNISTLFITLAATKDASEKFSLADNHYMSVPGIKLILTPISSGGGDFQYSTHTLGETRVGLSDEFHIPGKNFATVSIWRQKQRVRVYLNGTKFLDLPKALEADAIINSLVFASYAPDYDKKGGAFYINNIRLAVGSPDTRNKLITEGKFVTHGILFDVNSDKIKPASYGTLQDIASTLSSNSAVRVKIVGHTDSDGDDKVNLDLSKRRADAVKTMLTSTFGIDSARLETDGKGKSQPIDINTTPEGKANNRRVEFIKL